MRPKRIVPDARPGRLKVPRSGLALRKRHSFPQPLQPIPAWLLDKYADVIATAEI